MGGKIPELPPANGGNGNGGTVPPPTPPIEGSGTWIDSYTWVDNDLISRGLWPPNALEVVRHEMQPVTIYLGFHLYYYAFETVGPNGLTYHQLIMESAIGETGKYPGYAFWTTADPGKKYPFLKRLIDRLYTFGPSSF